MFLLLKEAISTDQCQTQDPPSWIPSKATNSTKWPLTSWSKIRTPKVAPKLLPPTVRTTTQENCRRLASQSTKQMTLQTILVTLSLFSLTLKRCWWWGSSRESSVTWISIKKMNWKSMRKWFKLESIELEPSDVSKKFPHPRTIKNRVSVSSSPYKMVMRKRMQISKSWTFSMHRTPPFWNTKRSQESAWTKLKPMVTTQSLNFPMAAPSSLSASSQSIT